MLYVEKRNGDIVPFDKQKIVNAINAAFIEVDGELYETDTAIDIANDIEALYLCHPQVNITVEDIQDLVEEYLMRSERKAVARAYIRYRYKREVARDCKEEFMSAIAEKLEARDVQNQNANVDEHSFGGRTGEAAGVMTKQYAIDYLLSDLAKNNHLNNEIYIHDLDNYAVGSHNCLSIPFDQLLANGFNTRQTDVRPAGSVNTAFQLVAVIFQLQSLQQFGGVSATHLDWTMVPYVRKSFYKHWRDGMKYFDEPFAVGGRGTLPDPSLSIEDPVYKLCYKTYHYALDMTNREVYQAVEGLFHNLNTLQSRSGNQLPFTSVNFGTCTLPEGRMISKAMLEVSIEGLGKNKKTSIFPCSIFQLGKGINRAPGDPNYDLYQLALRSTAQRLYPNYANIDWSNNAGYDPADPTTYFSTMGCRTANLMDVNGLGQQKDGRGNICPVTIIMPTLAMRAMTEMPKNAIVTKEVAKVYDENGNFIKNTEVTITKWDEVESFMELLDQKIHEAKDMLLERFEWICSQNPASAKFMYENGLMAGYIPEEGIRSALKHGTLAIGQIGLAETLQILVGQDHTEELGMELAKRIEALFKTRCAEFKEEYKLNFGVYYTPRHNWVA